MSSCLSRSSNSPARARETPYLSLLTRLFGDRTVVANATGCSSIYGGNLPTTPWTFNRDGRGPAWSNSLFEDNAEFGLGMRVAIDKQREYALELVEAMAAQIGEELAQAILEADQSTEEGINAQRERVAELKKRLQKMEQTPKVKDLLHVADALVKRSVWIVGGDGWAYDIGYGTMFWLLVATSTFWCSTPKCIPTPAARCPKPPRALQWPSLLRQANRCPRKTSR